ncbi:hypothetical protein [Amycolatopsis tolypomycina]|uniref:hypothetical protein n=1 Tax=Amycolatopsis tolypomycina TaxID=208445 RepID=UPI000B894E4A|nr:hypothetical protein [Amycolatopsis tolypomycina]
MRTDQPLFPAIRTAALGGLAPDAAAHVIDRLAGQGAGAHRPRGGGGPARRQGQRLQLAVRGYDRSPAAGTVPAAARSAVCR